jgi:uncharacterized protein YcbX
MLFPTHTETWNSTHLLAVAVAAVVLFLLIEYRMLFRCQFARWQLSYTISKQVDDESATDTSGGQQDFCVSSLYIYPLKSARRVNLQKVDLDELGVQNDRRLCVVRGKFPDKPVPRAITQRQAPSLITVSVSIQEDDTVTLSSPLCNKSVNVDVSDQALLKAKRLKVGIWEGQVLVADLGDKAAQFIQQIVRNNEIERGVSFGDARLISVLPNRIHSRPTASEGFPVAAYHRGKIPHVGMADAYPLLICSENSLEALNARLVKKGEAPVTMDRFRPNLVVKGCDAFVEDEWKVIKIGDTILHIISSCPRCKVCCIDQETGKASLEPLETLSEFREFGEQDEAYFGVYGVAQDLRPHTIHVGDEIKVLLEGDPTWDE